MPRQLEKHMMLEKNVNKLSLHLHKLNANVSNVDKTHLYNYTRGAYADFKYSKHLNDALIKNKTIKPFLLKIHNAIKNNTVKSDNEYTLYSGTKTDFGKLAKQSKDGILHSSAHISATHDLHQAHQFALNHKSNTYNSIKPHHIISIKVKPNDKILHLSRYSQMPHENETVIPSGTKLKYSHSEDFKDNNNNKIKMHHFTIHSQE